MSYDLEFLFPTGTFARVSVSDARRIVALLGGGRAYASDRAADVLASIVERADERRHWDLTEEQWDEVREALAGHEDTEALRELSEEVRRSRESP